VVEHTDIRVRELMTRRFVAAAPEDTLGEVAEKMDAAGLGSALVVEYGRLIGILTSRDVLRAVIARAHPSEARVREWMTPDPVTIAPDESPEEASRLMLEGRFHHLPVLEGGHPVGVIGLRAVVSALEAHFYGM
jgi:CBS domain-containing protein